MNLGLDRKMLCTNLTLEGSVKLPLMNTNQTVITISALWCVPIIKYRQMLSKH